MMCSSVGACAAPGGWRTGVSRAGVVVGPGAECGVLKAGSRHGEERGKSGARRQANRRVAANRGRNSRSAAGSVRARGRPRPARPPFGNARCGCAHADSRPVLAAVPGRRTQVLKPPLVSVGLEDDHLRQRERVRVRDRKQRRGGAESLEVPERGRRAMSGEAAAAAHDLDVAPGDAAGEARAKRLHRRLLSPRNLPA